MRRDCQQVIVVSNNREAISNAASAKPPALTLYHTLTRVRHWEQKIGVPVRYRWARAHPRLQGSERANELARKGAKAPLQPQVGAATLAWAQQHARGWLTQETAKAWRQEAPASYKALGIPASHEGAPQSLR